jgi:WD40 repeat protein
MAAETAGKNERGPLVNMPHRCPQGHSWEGEPATHDVLPSCPICSMATLPPSAAPPTATGDIVPAEPDEYATALPTSSGHRAEPWTGKAIAGYEIISELGRGGMGVVYRARHLKLDRVVALKMILGGGHAGPADLERFGIEAQAIARLQHPNIVQIFEVGQHEGLPFFSLEFCAGGTLAQQLAGTPLPPKEAAALVEILARAMHAAHQQGILHRDLKPANVLFAPCAAGQARAGQSKMGMPKITDFGLAKKLDEAGKTATGAVMGTPSYMAPEQAGGKSNELGPACDVYALGAVLYECLTGRPPFKAATALDTIIQVMADEPVPPRQLNAKVPADLETVCLKGLHKEPRKRYGSAEGLADDLGRYQRGEPVQARRVGRLERGLKWARRNPTPVTALAVAMIALLAIAVVLLLGTGVSTYFAVAARREAQAAHESELKALGNLYAAQMNQGWLSWQAGETSIVQEILDGQDPRTGGHDFRGFEWHYLWRLLHSERYTLREPQDMPKLGPLLVDMRQKVAFRPGHDQVAWVAWPAAFSGTAEVVLADMATGQPVRRFPGLWEVVFSPNGKYLAGFTFDNRANKVGGFITPDMHTNSFVTVWDADTGEKRATLPRGRLCAFSHDGKRLAVVIPSHRKEGRLDGPEGDFIRLYDWASGKEVATFPGDGNLIHCLAFSPNGNLLAAGYWPNTAGAPGAPKLSGRVWELATGKEMWVISPFSPKGLAFSADGTCLATVSGSIARLCSAENGRQLLELPRHGIRINSVLFSSDGKQLITAANDQLIRVWDRASGGLVRVIRGNTAPVISVALSPDDKWLVTMGLDCSVKLWDATHDQEARSLVLPRENIASIAFVPGSDQLAVCTNKGLHTWDLTDGKLQRDTRFGEFAPAQPGPLRKVLYSADGRRLVTVKSPADFKGESEVTVRDSRTKVARRFVIGRPRVAGFPMALSPDGRHLAIAGGASAVWDLDAEQPVLSLRAETTFMAGAVAFSPDGNRVAVAESFFKGKAGQVAVGNMGHRVIVKEFASGTTLATLPDAAVTALTFTPDKQQLLAVGERRVYQWDLPSGQKLRELALNTQFANPVFSPDCRRLATVSREGEEARVILWDMATGQRLLTLASVAGETLTFNRDGTRLAIIGRVGDDSEIKVWDATAAR